jgi:hypothetical protein
MGKVEYFWIKTVFKQIMSFGMRDCGRGIGERQDFHFGV